MLKVYNTLTRKKEVFKSLRKKEVRMYTCGPTVYSFVHIGNLRAFICADIFRKYFEYNGYDVKYVKNITDVGHFTEDDPILGQDKMLLATKKERKSPREVAQFYTKAFFEDEKKLNIKKADVYPKATEYIKEMIELIKVLIKKKYAYQISDGIYFHVPKFKNYGKLSGNTLNKLKKGVRIEPNPEKKHPADFALWKFAKPENLLQWPSPWGRGFPGWHIECSAMAMKNLGMSIDIHTGGEDNLFPHHEDEIAQSEAIFNIKFVKYWMHIRHLLVDGQKMSKSKENFFILQDLINRGYNPLSFRLLVLNSHYRSKLNFTFKGLKQAEKNLERISEFVNKIQNIKKQRGVRPPKVGSDPLKISSFQKQFEKAMDDDFNTPKALAVIFELINKGNSLITQNLFSENDAKSILEFFKKIDKIFNFIFWKKPKEKIPMQILKLAQEREKNRKEKKWQKADFLRKEIEKMGYLIEDTEKGFNLKKL